MYYFIRKYVTPEYSVSNFYYTLTTDLGIINYMTFEHFSFFNSALSSD